MTLEVREDEWVWACREGFESDLVAELRCGRILEPGLVAATRSEGMPTFGRQGFPVHACLPSTRERCAPVIAQLAGDGPFALHAWVPDTDAGNRCAQSANGLRAGALKLLPALAARERAATELDSQASLVSICLPRAETAWLGALPIHRAPSLWPGGKVLTKLPGRAPSRSAMKLAEAFSWLGFGPEANDRCVDLGAAPGGWTWLLLARGARVFAVDRARMHESIARDPRLTHVTESAFSWRPPKPVDWLLCDMVWKPSEVAALVARWGSARLCRFVLANFKLPMKRRLEVVQSVRKTIAG
ncbi:MAG: 23S rRNA (cytidine(2498)-2'-O)-methyltransferase RlmM, partial [Deltaproteobacteria bacterium]|nr:23S rRNA (cytidine(2498)-2'-O)-methyltransferase RlmM [Deltaproteobacteria bacterium]